MAENIKSRISITIAPMINDMLSKVSKRANISKSLLIEKVLKDFLKSQLETDAKTLSKLTFNDLPDEDEWLSLQPKLD